MAKKKTSMSFNEDTIRIIAQRASEENLDRSSYLEQLVQRDDLRRRIVADTATLRQAGFTGERSTQITAKILASRGRAA